MKFRFHLLSFTIKYLEVLSSKELANFAVILDNEYSNRSLPLLLISLNGNGIKFVK